MNERIKELDKQARLWAIDNTNFPISSHIPSGYTEKFAELIVQECVKVAVFKDSGMVATADVAGHMAAGRSIAARMINEHFGVKE